MRAHPDRVASIRELAESIGATMTAPGGGQGGDGASGGQGAGQSGQQGGQQGGQGQEGQQGGNAGQGGQQTTGTGSQGQQGTQNGQQGQEGQQGQGQAPDGQRVEDLPQWAQDLIRSTRSEAAENRTGRQSAEQSQQSAQAIVDAVNAALGNGQGQEVTADQLSAQLQERDTALAQERAVNAAYRRAGTNGANADALVDSVAFRDALFRLDPSSDSFTTDLDNAIQSAVQANGNLRAQSSPGAARSGGEHAGGSGAPRQEPQSIREALRARAQS